MQPQSKPELIFCHSQANPDSLVMLYDHEHVLQKMLKPPDQLYFLWMTESPNHLLQHQIYQIQQETGSSIITLTNEENLREFLLKNKHTKNITIICKTDLVNKIDLLDRRKQVTTVIEYPAQIDEDQDQHSQQQNQNEEDQSKEYNHIKATTESMLLKLIKNYSKINGQSYKQLMNFVFLKNNVWTSNVLIRSMIAMLNQEIDLQTRRQIVNQFSKLTIKIDKQNNFQEIIKELMQGPLSIQRAIYWYTNSVGVYKIINNLLRATTHPSEILYLQPLFKDIFSAIQQIHKTAKRQNFLCYRGGSLFKTQIQQMKRNVGHVVKNLSFLSTSLSQETALLFKQNVLFEILVAESEKSQEGYTFGYGYANIKKFSYFAGEEEILFNPLCSFKITEIKQFQKGANKQAQFLIRLSYGGLEKLTKKYANSNEIQLNENQKSLCGLGKLWKNQQSETKSQGDVLIARTQSLQNASAYWRKYQQIANNPTRKAYGLIKLGISLKNSGTYNNELFTKAIQIIKAQQIISGSHEQHNRDTNTRLIDLYKTAIIQLAEAKNTLGKQQQAQKICQEQIRRTKRQDKFYTDFSLVLAQSLFYLGQLQKAAKLLVQISQFTRNKFGEYRIEIIPIILDEAQIYNGMGKFEQALKLLSSCSQKILVLVGERHPFFLRCLFIMCQTFVELGKMKKGHQLFQKFFKLTKQTFGMNSIRFVMNLNQLTKLIYKMGDYQQASQLCEICLKICQKNQDESQIFLKYQIIFLDLYSQILGTQQKYYQAHEKITTAYNLSVKQLGENNPSTLKLLPNLGTSLSCLNKLKQAEQILTRYSKTLLEATGQNNQKYISSLQDLVYIYEKMGKYEKALQLCQKCLSLLSKKKYGEKDICYIGAFEYCAVLYCKMKQYQRAESMLKKCLQFKKQFFGEAHPRTIISFFRVGDSLFHQRKSKKALEMFEKSYKLEQQISNQKSQNFLKLSNKIAILNLEMGEVDKAIQIQEKCCSVLEQHRYLYP